MHVPIFHDVHNYHHVSGPFPESIVIGSWCAIDESKWGAFKEFNYHKKNGSKFNNSIIQ